MSFVIDCIASPSTTAMRAAGVVGLTRYLSWLDRDSLGKIIHQAEYNRLIGDGFALALNWEYSATDWLGGSSAGLAHAAEAVRQARALGYPAGCVILGSADFNMSLAQWGSAGAGYARAFSTTVRGAGYLAGVYGPYDVLTWCRDAGWADIFWQAGMSTSWSGGRNANAWPGAHLRQRRQVFVGGTDCDYNDILNPSWGQCLGGAPLNGATMPDALTWNAAWMLQRILEDADPIVVPPNAALDAPGFSIPNVPKQERLKLASDAKAAASLPATVTMTDADHQAIADLIGAKIDALTAAMNRLTGAELAEAQAEVSALTPPPTP